MYGLLSTGTLCAGTLFMETNADQNLIFFFFAEYNMTIMTVSADNSLSHSLGPCC